MTTLNRAIDKSLRDLRFDLYKAELTHSDVEAVTLAKDLLAWGKALEQRAVENLSQTLFDGVIERDADNPSDYIWSNVIGQDWADHESQPLRQGEHWNQHNRASNTGIKYALDKDGYPINPFYNYGVTGRGMVGRFGPNHAVDVAPCRIGVNGKRQLCLQVLGIVREDSGLPALCGGFTTFEKQADGTRPYTKDVQYKSQTQEFFEELISGSVKLLPQYAKGLDDDIAREVDKRRITQKNGVSDKQAAIIAKELTTQRKLKQVAQENPEFLDDIYQKFANATQCYAGPVFSSTRNTNQAWMETKLSWFMLSDPIWVEMKKKGKFDYKFSADDDAYDALWHEVTPDLIAQSGNHGPLFCYVLSSWLAHSQNANPLALAAVKQQAKAILEKPALPTRKLEALTV